MSTKQNFADIFHYFLRGNDEQSLQILVTKTFYFLRRNQLENLLDFFFEPLHLNSTDSDAHLYGKLCVWKFYIEELSQFYSDNFKKFVLRYLSTDSPSIYLLEAISNGGHVLQFNAIYNIFKAMEILNIDRILSIWNQEKIPISVYEAALAASFPDSIFLHYLSKFENILISEELKKVLRDKSLLVNYDKLKWEKFIDFELIEPFPFSHQKSQDNEKIFIDIQSKTPADIAYELFNIRKSIEDNPKFEVNKRFIDSIVSLVSHDERYSLLFDYYLLFLVTFT